MRVNVTLPGRLQNSLPAASAKRAPSSLAIDFSVSSRSGVSKVIDSSDSSSKWVATARSPQHQRVTTLAVLCVEVAADGVAVSPAAWSGDAGVHAVNARNTGIAASSGKRNEAVNMPG